MPLRANGHNGRGRLLWRHMDKGDDSVKCPRQLSTKATQEVAVRLREVSKPASVRNFVARS